MNGLLDGITYGQKKSEPWDVDSFKVALIVMEQLIYNIIMPDQIV
jgi:hypothetical protein